MNEIISRQNIYNKAVFSHFLQNNTAKNTEIHPQNTTTVSDPARKKARKVVVNKLSAFTGGGILLVGLGVGYLIKTKNFRMFLEKVSFNLRKNVPEKQGFFSKINDNIIEFLKKRAEKTVKKNYKNVDFHLKSIDKNLSNLIKNLDNDELKVIDKNGKNITVNLREMGYDTKKLKENIENNYNKIKIAIKSLASGSDDRLGRIENLIKKSKSYPDLDCQNAVIKTRHDDFKNNFYTLKDNITHTTFDNFKRIIHLIDHSQEKIDKSKIDIDNKELKKYYQDLKNILFEYDIANTDGVQEGVSNKVIREQKLNEFKESLNNLIETIKSRLSDNSANECANESVQALEIKLPSGLFKKEVTERMGNPAGDLERIKDYITQDKKGLIEELRDILKVQLPKDAPPDIQMKYQSVNDEYNLLKASNPELYEKIKQHFNDINNLLNKAAILESDKYFYRLKDLGNGCAIPEIATAVLPLPIVAASVGKQKTPEDKKKAFVEKGLPTIGGMAAWCYATMFRMADKKVAALTGLLTGTVIGGVSKIIENKKVSQKNKLNQEAGQN